MQPAFSVILLTTLIGTGQGFFLALVSGQIYSIAHFLPKQTESFYAYGSFIAGLFLIIGLLASFFHLGRPERAWRAAKQWRTSWLAREVIILPLVIILAFGYGLAHWFTWTQPAFQLTESLTLDPTLLLGLLGLTASLTLFICTAMIYTSVVLIQEWNTPLTVTNFIFMGSSSGFLLAAAYSAMQGVSLVTFFGTWAAILMLIGTTLRLFQLARNNKLEIFSNLSTALGIRHTALTQIAQGSTGGSFNTREFFHGQHPRIVKIIRRVFFGLILPIPLILIIISFVMNLIELPILAFVLQFLGIIAERWLFFIDAHHPQNIYYQAVA